VIQVEVFWVVMAYSVVVDRGSKFLQNVDILLQHYTVLQCRRPQLEFNVA